MNKRSWNTYATVCYTYDVANDQRSAGGVHHHQVRHTASGWQRRILQANGTAQAAGPVVAISVHEGEASFATAQQKEGRD